MKSMIRLRPGQLKSIVGRSMTAPPISRPGAFRKLGRGALLAGCLAVLLSGAARAGMITYTSLDVPKPIPDYNSPGITSNLVVTDGFLIGDLDLIFDELLHESISDLRIELTSPAGTTALLVQAAAQRGILTGLGSRDNFIDTIFNDQAPTNLADAFFDNHTGSYNIAHDSVGSSPLAAFNGENAQGTWVLRISDQASRDVGVLNRWSLRFTSAGDVAPVPEPSSVALLGLGACGLWIVRRKGPWARRRSSGA